MSPRVLDWQTRLQAVIALHMYRPFAYGSNDCATFAGACVLACTGVPRLDPEDQHDSAASADRYIARRGGLASMVTQRMGPPVAPGLAAVGDVGLYREGEREALAVQVGGAWMAPTIEGLRVVQPGAVLQAWRVEGG